MKENDLIHISMSQMIVILIRVYSNIIHELCSDSLYPTFKYRTTSYIRICYVLSVTYLFVYVYNCVSPHTSTVFRTINEYTTYKTTNTARCYGRRCVERTVIPLRTR